MKSTRILIYKRTHNGDPDPDGCFGVFDCMGSVRDRAYDAVIGVGGIGAEASSNGIAGTVNWIGIGPHKKYVEGKRGPEVTFDHFIDFGEDGPKFTAVAPMLAARIYEQNVRCSLHGLSDDEMAEAMAIVQLAVDAPPSRSRESPKEKNKTPAKCEKQRRTRIGIGARIAPGPLPHHLACGSALGDSLPGSKRLPDA